MSVEVIHIKYLVLSRIEIKLMKLTINNKSYTFFCVLFLTACTQPYDRTDYVDPRELSEELFSQYGYEYKNMLVKEKGEINSVHIEKNKMSKENFNNIVRKKIKEHGWVEVDPEFEDRHLYCYGAKNRMSIMFPTKQHYKNREGNVIDINENLLNKWVVSFLYNAHGVSGCKHIK